MSETGKPYRVKIRWGLIFGSRSGPVEYAYETRAELEAFMWGVEELAGSMLQSIGRFIDERPYENLHGFERKTAGDFVEILAGTEIRDEAA